MADHLGLLREYLQDYSLIKLLTDDTVDYDAVRKCFIHYPARVLAIVRPQSTEDVQALVRFCAQNSVEFVIRTGGHDCTGRSQIEGALMIDMRDIAYVEVADSKTSARIGGGTLLRQVTRELGQHGLVTPCGTAPTVGYVGWCTLGGYGPLTSAYGIGVDQIIGAKVVNAAGELIEADEELLTAIRGGGGSLGAIVEITIKVYPLNEILVGFLVFESSNLETPWSNYGAAYQRILSDPTFPRSLGLQPMVSELPGLGYNFAVVATWAGSDHSEGRGWIDKIAASGNCTTKSIYATTVSEHNDMIEKTLVYGSHGRGFTLCFKNFTPRTVELLAKHSKLLPGGRTCMIINELRRPEPNENSVFGAREQHCVLDLIAFSPDEAVSKLGAEWAQAVKKDFQENDPTNLLDHSYIALLGEDDTDLNKIYGSRYDRLLAIKKKHDPSHVFKWTIPRLPQR
ncbi:hypothetical protein BX600DRAFT_511155 [Xylariales sp. PMI_506]|nr:hypothetical protein BX600DRAFT_511155 [Xylariales sp. PMI_506]